MDIAKTTQMTRKGLDPYGLHTLAKNRLLIFAILQESIALGGKHSEKQLCLGVLVELIVSMTELVALQDRPAKISNDEARKCACSAYGRMREKAPIRFCGPPQTKRPT